MKKPGFAPARYWQKAGDGKVACNLCPRGCVIGNSKRGFCYVRANIDGELVLTTYGRSSGFCIDPVEKKPLNHFLPGTAVLSFGTAGCNLGCKFCQNCDISHNRMADRLNQTAMPEAIANAAKAHNCPSVAYTYNDPIIFSEYAQDTAIACHERGIKNIAVTAGYITDEARPDFFKFMDATNVDLKAFSNDFYKRLCAAELEPVLDTLRYICHETDVWLEISTLIVPGENDSETELDALTSFVANELSPDVPIHFSAFHPAHKVTDKPATPATTLIRAREIGKRNGLRHVYTGNIHSKDNASTFCHNCGALLIERDWYELGFSGMDDTGKCNTCSTQCAGVFNGGFGDWGRKRQVVDMSLF